jgi:hypothetical protein
MPPSGAIGQVYLHGGRHSGSCNQLQPRCDFWRVFVMR